VEIKWVELRAALRGGRRKGKKEEKGRGKEIGKRFMKFGIGLSHVCSTSENACFYRSSV
jgi:hypothetical protein